MAKMTNFELKTIEVNGESYDISCYTTSTRMYVTEHAECRDLGVNGIYKWENRPWQSFKYQSALRDLARKLQKRKSTKEIGDEIESVLVNGEEKKVWEKVEKECKAFEELFKKTPQSFKDAVAKSDVIMNSEEDVKSMKGLMALATLIG